MLDPEKLGPEWVSTPDALRLLGMPRAYGKLRWLHQKGLLKSRLEFSARKIFWRREEVANVVIAQMRERAPANETYSNGGKRGRC